MPMPPPDSPAQAERRTQEVVDALPTDSLLALLGTLADQIAAVKTESKGLYDERALAIRALHARGLSLSAIAAAARVSPPMVQRYTDSQS